MIPSERIPGPAYRLHTRRLILRCLEPKDAPALSLAVEQSLDHLIPWVPWAKHEPLTLQQRIELLRKWRGSFDLGTDFEYGILNLDESIIFGVTRLHADQGKDAREIGFWIHKDYINRGYATETSAALTKIAFEVDRVNRVEIHCAPGNVRSAAVPKKLGFIHEATLHNRGLDSQGNLRDSMIWTLFADDYPGSPAAESPVEAYDAIGRRIL